MLDIEDHRAAAVRPRWTLRSFRTGSAVVDEVHYNEARRRFALVRYEPRLGSVDVLLRFDGAEHESTRTTLRRLGFRPSASPAARAISFASDTSVHGVGGTLARLSSALGDGAVLDLGACFVDCGREALRRSSTAHGWDGRFLVHAGGTRRCVVFDANADEADVAAAFRAAYEDYELHDFAPATE